MAPFNINLQRGLQSAGMESNMNWKLELKRRMVLDRDYWVIN